MEFFWPRSAQGIYYFENHLIPFPPIWSTFAPSGTYDTYVLKSLSLYFWIHSILLIVVFFTCSSTRSFFNEAQYFQSQYSFWPWWPLKLRYGSTNFGSGSLSHLGKIGVLLGQKIVWIETNHFFNTLPDPVLAALLSSNPERGNNNALK